MALNAPVPRRSGAPGTTRSQRFSAATGSANDLALELVEFGLINNATILKVGETVKNLMLSTADGRIIQVVLPGDKRFDSKGVAKKVGTKSVTFAKPETVLDVAGCEVGCVPPFGHLKPVQVYMDRQLLWKKFVYFNPGVHSKSVKIEAGKLKELCKPIML